MKLFNRIPFVGDLHIVFLLYGLHIESFCKVFFNRVPFVGAMQKVPLCGGLHIESFFCGFYIELLVWMVYKCMCPVWCTHRILSEVDPSLTGFS